MGIVIERACCWWVGIVYYGCDDVGGYCALRGVGIERVSDWCVLRGCWCEKTCYERVGHCRYREGWVLSIKSAYCEGVV